MSELFAIVYPQGMDGLDAAMEELRNKKVSFDDLFHPDSPIRLDVEAIQDCLTKDFDYLHKDDSAADLQLKLQKSIEKLAEVLDSHITQHHKTRQIVEAPAPGSLASGIETRRQTQTKAAKEKLIMGTNDSSILSKRSVERYYYPEPHFFRHFVGKPKRRIPLINRGYWFRMYAIEKIVKRFLSETTDKRKVVLNLGCGYDALPFQLLSKEKELCRKTTFVDVDFPGLMESKSQTVRDTEVLRDMLDRVPTSSGEGNVFLRSAQYVAIGCDLQDLDGMDRILREQLDIRNCSILVVAEVSITYMDRTAADKVVAYAAGLGDVRFCLLEQFLPATLSHPFAHEMMSHFKKLQAPLKSISHYPELDDQEIRFQAAGWLSVTARSLWDLWSDSRFISAKVCSSLNSIEPFDEWEEFALFASHYFLLVASNTSRGSIEHLMDPRSQDSLEALPRVPAPGSLANGLDPVRYSTSASHFTGNESVIGTSPIVSKDQARVNRRFGVLYQSSKDNFCHHSGFGDKKRLDTTDMYVTKDATPVFCASPPPRIQARMCHTVTTLPEVLGSNLTGLLIVGGRTSPNCALADCWVQQNQIWERVEDLPTPLYRHCATRVIDNNGQNAVLVYGGKSNHGVVSNGWLLWHDASGWTQLDCDNSRLLPRFGAAIGSDGGKSGVLLGGMSEDGRVLRESWLWSIDFMHDVPIVKITSGHFESAAIQTVVCRFGASLTQAPDCLLLVGGVSYLGILPDDYEVIQIKLNSGPLQICSVSKQRSVCGPKPLLVGHSSVWDGDGLVIVGGGAICFSFGNYTNAGIWKISASGRTMYDPWVLKSPGQQPGSEGRPRKRLRLTLNGRSDRQESFRPAPTLVTRHRKLSADRFKRFVNRSQPILFEGLKLGPCVDLWTTEYLKRTIGLLREVVIHHSETRDMNFQEKNFQYQHQKFGTFIDNIVDGEMQYLRSLSNYEQDKPANFITDFLPIAEDFQFPAEFQLSTDNFHSSVLRISGPVAMWLHYDVMANVLCQIRGTKRLVLFPPSDIELLKIPHGKSTSTINVFDADSTHKDQLSGTHPQEVILRPGEVLFIPPLWCHAACPLDGISVSVNVFFRSLARGYSIGQDLYGNRDIQAYEDGRRDILRIANRFAGQPSDMIEFYLQRLASELEGIVPESQQ